MLIRHAEPLLALGLAAALEGPDFEVLPAADAAQAARADLIISDPGCGLRLLTADAPRQAPAARMLIVAIALDDAQMHAAIRAGAHGYMLLQGGAGPLDEIVRSMVRGTRYLCPLAARHLAESLSHDALTEREMTVLRLLVRGRSNKVIGNSLDITADTAKAHVKNIMAKLRVRSRTEAVGVAIERGLVSRGLVAAQEAAGPRQRQRQQAQPPKAGTRTGPRQDAAAGFASCDRPG